MSVTLLRYADREKDRHPIETEIAFDSGSSLVIGPPRFAGDLSLDMRNGKLSVSANIDAKEAVHLIVALANKLTEIGAMSEGEQARLIFSLPAS